MDPVSSWAVGVLAERLVTRFKGDVIERWTRRRAQEFFLSFLREVNIEWSSGNSSQTLDQLLDQMTEDEEKSAILFDAYRSVAFARSRIIGPRVIGLLTAQLLLSTRPASEGERAIFELAESATDPELESAAEFILKVQTGIASGDRKYMRTETNISVDWSTKEFSTEHYSQDVPAGPISTYRELGSWASRLEKVGMLWLDVSETIWPSGGDDDLHIEPMNTSTLRQWTIHLQPEVELLRELIARAVDRPC